MSPQLKSKAPDARYCLLPFAIAWTAFSVFWTAMAASMGGWFAALFGIPFVLIGAAMLVGVFLPNIRALKIAAPEVSVSNDTLRRGERFTFIYRQAARRPLQVNRFSVEFVFRESATYRQGTDTTTVTHERSLDGVEQGARSLYPGDVLQEQREFIIPLDAMHTLEASNNKLQYFVKVRLDIASWPDVKEEYEIKVLPEGAAVPAGDWQTA